MSSLSTSLRIVFERNNRTIVQVRQRRRPVCSPNQCVKTYDFLFFGLIQAPEHAFPPKFRGRGTEIVMNLIKRKTEVGIKQKRVDGPRPNLGQTNDRRTRSQSKRRDEEEKAPIWRAARTRKGPVRGTGHGRSASLRQSRNRASEMEQWRREKTPCWTELGVSLGKWRCPLACSYGSLTKRLFRR
jgi:hypothetical protein